MATILIAGSAMSAEAPKILLPHRVVASRAARILAGSPELRRSRCFRATLASLNSHATITRMMRKPCCWRTDPRAHRHRTPGRDHEDRACPAEKPAPRCVVLVGRTAAATHGQACVLSKSIFGTGASSVSRPDRPPRHPLRIAKPAAARVEAIEHTPHRAPGCVFGARLPSRFLHRWWRHACAALAASCPIVVKAMAPHVRYRRNCSASHRLRRWPNLGQMTAESSCFR